MDTSDCTEKMAFDTKKAAQDAARMAYYRHGSKLKVYKCRHCGLWHMATRHT
jgi:hypothetical protein